MKKILFLLASSWSLCATAQVYQWAKGISSPNALGFYPNLCLSTDVDTSGYLHVTGSSRGTNVDFNPGGAPLTLSSTFNNVYFAKYSPSGACLWVKSIVGASNARGECIRIGPGGAIYITGVFGGANIDFDPGPGTATLSGSPSSLDFFIAKYDAGGNYLWAKGFGSSGNDYSKCLSLDAAGNVYVTGTFNSPTVDFDPGPGIANLNLPGMFFAKYDSNGNYLWAHSFAGASVDWYNSVSVDPAGNACIAGTFGGNTTDFDPGPGTATLNASGNNLFFARYDSGGNYLWVKSIPSPASAAINANSSGIYLGGFFIRTNVDFDPGPSTATLSSSSSGTTIGMYLAKYDHNGNYLWAKALGNAAVTQLVLSASGKVYVGGTFNFQGQPADFDPGPGTATLTGQMGANNVFFAKYDANGNYVWAKSILNISTTGTNHRMAVDASENVFLGGEFAGTNIDFDPNPGTATMTSAGNGSMYLAKYNYCSQQVNNPKQICTGESYALNGNLYTTSGFYTDTLYTPSGCDSIVVTQLTVSGQPPLVSLSSSSVLCTSSSNTLTAGGANTYTWSTGAQTPMIVVTPSTVMQYIVAGTGTNGCIGNDTINVLPSPTLGIVSMQAICKGEQISLTASGASSYTWSTGAQTPTISAILNSATAYTVMGTVTTNTLCRGVGTVTIQVMPCVGLKSNPSQSVQLKIYPNPVNTDLFYTVNTNGGHRYTITDVNGHTVSEGEQSGAKVTLDVSQYPPGIYNLSITIGKASLSKRFLVERP